MHIYLYALHVCKYVIGMAMSRFIVILWATGRFESSFKAKWYSVSERYSQLGLSPQGTYIYISNVVLTYMLIFDKKNRTSINIYIYRIYAMLIDDASRSCTWLYLKSHDSQYSNVCVQPSCVWTLLFVIKFNPFFISHIIYIYIYIELATELASTKNKCIQTLECV
jgi:hypothetical protein